MIFFLNQLSLLFDKMLIFIISYYLFKSFDSRMKPQLYTRTYHVIKIFSTSKIFTIFYQFFTIYTKNGEQYNDYRDSFNLPCT